MKKVRIERSYSKLGFEIWLADFCENETFVVSPLTVGMEKLPEGSAFPQSTFFLREAEMLQWAKAFLEGLEEAGLADRLREDQGVLSSTREHLKDIQKISDRLLSIVERKI
jgi:hypothetical protein